MGSNPTRAALFPFRIKKELFGLVVLPCFIFIGLRVSTHLNMCSMMRTENVAKGGTGVSKM